MDFATRAYNHGFRIDPIVRSLLDTDFYKLLMLQFIWKLHFNTKATFALNNRTKSVLLANQIDENELRAQLDHVRTLRFTSSELVWLRGQTFYGQSGLFEDAFIDYLRTFSLPEYKLEKTSDGQYALEFEGLWRETSMWEIYALAIVNEMRNRSIMNQMSKSDLDIMYARAKVLLRDKLDRLTQCPDLQLTDFGTRRRHSFLWQEYCIQTAKDVLGARFTGTSNALMAMRHNLEAKGTNAHELPMVYAALANSDEELKQSQYKVLKDWQNVYRGGLLVMLPDTFGTTQFLDGLSPILARSWTGARPDSKPGVAAGEELIAFWDKHDPAHRTEKLIIFSDGLDVHVNGRGNGEDIPTLYERFNGRARIGFGWGTNFTNGFKGCHPTDPDKMKAISLVCKVKSANGRGAVKLSDNLQKSTGVSVEVERYKKVFGRNGITKMTDAPNV